MGHNNVDDSMLMKIAFTSRPLKGLYEDIQYTQIGLEFEFMFALVFSPGTIVFLQVLMPIYVCLLRTDLFVWLLTL